MATLQNATELITVKEGQGRYALQLTLEEDYSSTVLVLYLIDRLGDVHEVGAATGVGKGQDMIISPTFDVPPGLYKAEVGPQDRSLPAIWPQQGQEGEVKVEDIGYNN